MKFVFTISLLVISMFSWSQNVGIGTVVPNARLHVTDSNVVFTGPASVPATTNFNPALQGAGARLMWYPQKASFRTGAVDGTQWDKLNIGRYSTATGFNTIASGDGSFASGNGSSASGNTASAMGYSVVASGAQSFATGYGANAAGNISVALGFNTTASGFNSLATGSSSSATGITSAVFGSNNKAKSDNSFVVGEYNDTSNVNRLFEIGNGTSSARHNAVTVLKNGFVGIGITDPAVLLHTGNGSVRFEGPESAGLGYSLSLGGFGYFSIDGPAAPSGRFMVAENGNVGIGNSNPGRKLSFAPATGEKIQFFQAPLGEYGMGVYPGELRLHADQPGSFISFGTQNNSGVFTELGRFQGISGYAMSLYGNLWVNGSTYASDERFKKNITPLQSSLQKLLQINGVEYDMKTGEYPEKNFKSGRQMGLLAQNVEKVAPDAVSELNGYKGVDYARLVPLLIESIKEQQKQIEELKRSLNELQHK